VTVFRQIKEGLFAFAFEVFAQLEQFRHNILVHHAHEDVNNHVSSGRSHLICLLIFIIRFFDSTSTFSSLQFENDFLASNNLKRQDS
jgi:hypothetical protein